jgi:hypothetical protein
VHRENHLQFTALFNICAVTGHAFALKTAYHEEFKALRPGVFLESEYLRMALDEFHAPWIDSCADGGNNFLSHLWRENRTIFSVAVSHGNVYSKFAVTLDRAARRICLKKPNIKYCDRQTCRVFLSKKFLKSRTAGSEFSYSRRAIRMEHRRNSNAAQNRTDEPDQLTVRQDGALAIKFPGGPFAIFTCNPF